MLLFDRAIGRHILSPASRTGGAVGWLQPVPQGEALVGVPGPFVGGAGGVAGEHVPAPPAGQAHEVAFVAAGGEPGVGEGVAELVGVDAAEAGPLAPALEHGGQARFVEAAPALDPQPGLLGVGVAAAEAQVAVDGEGRLAAEWAGPFAPALAEDEGDLPVEGDG